jgi:hypothetical protein
MGLDQLFAVAVSEAVSSPPRTTCAKCGESLGFRYRENTHRAMAAYCPPCQWLLRDTKINVFLEATRPSDAVVKSLGVPLNWDERQHAEPIPMVVLNVEQWPEIDVVPQFSSPAWDSFDGMESN